MTDIVPPENTHQPPSTAAPEKDTPLAPPPSAADPTSLELESVTQTTLSESAPPVMAATPETAELPVTAEAPVIEKEAPVVETEPTVVDAEKVFDNIPDRDTEPPPAVAAKRTEDVTELEKSTSLDLRKLPESMMSFKEESNKVSDLSDLERKALEELKLLVQEAIDNHSFTATKTQETPSVSSESKTQFTEITNSPQELSIWGVPLLEDERSDVILLKFLRGRDFKVKESFAMLKNTILWRKEFNIDELINEKLEDDLDKVVFMHGHDKEGHSVCYNVYGEFQNKELYNNTFGDEEKRKKFLRWRIQFLERSIRKLDFNPGGVNTIFQVSDLKNSPGPGLRIATRQALHLLQDNYPEFVAKQVFINVPWWYLAFYTMISPFLTQRTKSKFVIASPSKTAETLFKYISPEQVPVQYGGLSVDYCECNPEFTVDDPATEIIIKPARKQTVEIIVNEKCIIVWELRVLGWDVTYSAEFVPNTDGAYTVSIQKPRKMTPTDEPVVANSFQVVELGKILLTIDNPTSKKKTLVYRFKDKLF